MTCRPTKRQPKPHLDVDFIICERVADLPVPLRPAKQIACCECREMVWISEKTLALAAGPPLCFVCAVKKVASGDEFTRVQ